MSKLELNVAAKPKTPPAPKMYRLGQRFKRGQRYLRLVRITANKCALMSEGSYEVWSWDTVPFLAVKDEKGDFAVGCESETFHEVYKESPWSGPYEAVNE